MLTGMIQAAISAAKNAGLTTKTKSSNKTGSVALFDPDFDYAQAIADTSDAKQREQLLAARQAKMDTLGLDGKIAGNDAVAQWRGDYRPYWVSGGQSQQLEVTGLYDAAARARLEGFEAARRKIDSNLQAQYGEIDAAYRAGTTQAGVDARRSALAGEEKLAALGLSQGAAYAAPSSGYTESSRVAMDNAYRADLNALTQTHQTARSAAARNAEQERFGLQSGYYDQTAAAALSQAQSQLSERKAALDYSLSAAGLTGYLNGVPTLKNRSEQAQVQADAEKTAYEQAITRWKTYGYVLPKDAGLLGVAAGTPTSDQSYRTAQLRLSQIKTNYQMGR